MKCNISLLEIPKDAENIEFEEWAAFMQGG